VSIQVPTLSVVHPDEIWSGFAQIHEAAVSHIPHCQAATVAVKSHLLQIAEPVLVAQAISSFVVNRLFEAARKSDFAALTPFPSVGAIDRYAERCADLSHAAIAQSTKTINEDSHRHAFNGVKIDRRTSRDRIVGGFQNDLTVQPSDRGRARRHQRTPKSRYCCVPGQHHNGAPAGFG
jgi:hypothetical protein